MNLSITNLSKTYANGVRALHDVSLDIPAGARYGLGWGTRTNCGMRRGTWSWVWGQLADIVARLRP